MKEDITIFGAGGLGKEVECLIEAINVDYDKYNFIGYFDDAYPTKKTWNDKPVI
ncbi:hexapeptide transferase, partial [Fulvivirga sp. RKSG066]|nr:hexapeptide transferase [Fulvivirga aurantia]